MSKDNNYQPPTNENQTGSNDMPALEPCPFCGGDGELIIIGNDMTKRRSSEIKCTTFGCQSVQRVSAIRHPIDWCNEKAVEKWNARSYTKTSTNNDKRDRLIDAVKRIKGTLTDDTKVQVRVSDVLEIINKVMK